LAAGSFSFFVALVIALFFKKLIEKYGVSPEYIKIAEIFVAIGLINMVLQTLYGSLDGIMIACGLQRPCMIIAGLLLISNISIDQCAISFFFNGQINPNSIFVPMLIIGASNIAL
jgi:Na+-driven multidrug efflux pump